jgi:hypothetical protein
MRQGNRAMVNGLTSPPAIAEYFTSIDLVRASRDLFRFDALR